MYFGKNVSTVYLRNVSITMIGCFITTDFLPSIILFWKLRGPYICLFSYGRYFWLNLNVR